MTVRNPALLITLLAALALLVACGDETPTSLSVQPTPTIIGMGSLVTPTASGPTPTRNPGVPTPAVGANGQITVIAPTPSLTNFSGTFFYIKGNDIWQSGVSLPGIPGITPKLLGGVKLTKTDQLAITRSPALSPDGVTLAYAYSPPPVPDASGKITVGQDILAYDLNSKGTKTLVQRDQNDTFLDEPAWSADGKYLYYSFRAPVRDKSGVVVGQRLGIERLEMATGKREHLTEDARFPAPSPDGKFLVYVGVDATNQTFDYSLKILDLTTRKVKELATPDMNFLGYFAPRVSPDSQSIIFSAPGGPDIPANQLYQPESVPSPTPRAEGSVRAAAHGLPYDLWLIKPDGSGLRRLTALFEDQPVPIWTKDGKKVVFLAGLGLYTLDVGSASISKNSDEGSHEGFDYRE